MKRVFQTIPAGSSNRSLNTLQRGKNGPEEDNGVGDDSFLVVPQPYCGKGR